MAYNVGKRIAALSAGRKDKDVAKAVGVAPSTYSAYVNGVSLPGTITLDLIAKELGTTVDFLLNGDSSKTIGDTLEADVLQIFRFIARHGYAGEAISYMEYLMNRVGERTRSESRGDESAKVRESMGRLLAEKEHIKRLENLKVAEEQAEYKGL